MKPNYEQAFVMHQNEWDDVFAPDEKLVRTLIGHQFDRLNTQEVEYVGEGWDSVAYRCGQWVFRFPRRPVGVSTLGTEARILPQVGKDVLVGQATADFPYLFLGTRFQTGFPLEKYKGPRRVLATELGAFLAKLHRSVLPHGLPADPGKLDLERRYAQIQKHLGRLPDWVPTEPPKEKKAVLLHGDIYCRHIYVSSQGHLEDLIDWGDLCQGHRGIDLSCGWSCFDAPDRELFWKAYGEVEEETLNVSRFRALYHSLLVSHYAKAKGFADLLSETTDALHRILY